MANSGKDTNGSQFFVTVGPQRALDFNHTIWGQLIRGFDILTAVNNVAVDGNMKPTTPVTITSATIIQDNHDAVLTVNAAAGATGTSTITVTGTDSVTGESSMQNFTATVVTPDTTNDPPILGPVANQVTTVGTPVTFTVPATDIDGGAMTFAAVGPTRDAQGNPIGDANGNPVANATVTVSNNQITVTPNSGFVGTIQLMVGVKEAGATTRGSTIGTSANDIRIFDTQIISVTVNPAPPSPPDLRTFNQKIADTIFQALLGRAASSSDEAGMGAALDKGLSPTRLALQIESSPEFRMLEVQKVYETLLGRAPDDAALTQAVNFLQHGGNLKVIRAVILGSPEFLQKQTDGTVNGFLNTLFMDVLGHAIDATNQTALATLLSPNTQAERQGIALDLLRGDEANARIGQLEYQTFLGRAASAFELQAVTGALEHSAEEAEIANLLGSLEKLQKI